MAVGHRPGNLGELRNLELAIPTDRLIPEGDSMRGGTAKSTGRPDPAPLFLGHPGKFDRLE
jgi:hypothetical protein